MLALVDSVRDANCLQPLMASEYEALSLVEGDVELDSIAAIYPELRRDLDNSRVCFISLPVELITPVTVTLPSVEESSEELDLLWQQPLDEEDSHRQVEETTCSHYISHLPPLQLRIELPQGYPAKNPPIIQLSTEPAWLPDEENARLTNDAARLWEEYGRDLVIYAYIDHLQNIASTAFSLADEVENEWEGTLMVSPELKTALMDFDARIRRQRFEQLSFVCTICLDAKQGLSCYQLKQCSHVFCVECLQGFYGTCIREGDITSVRCLDPDCGKVNRDTAVVNQGGPHPPVRDRGKASDRTLSPSELLQIPIDLRLVQRYAGLKRKIMLESDRTNIFCPRNWCQGVASREKSNRASPPSGDDVTPAPPAGPNAIKHNSRRRPNSLDVAICTDCSFAFCPTCHHSWHGPFTLCRPSAITLGPASSKPLSHHAQQRLAAQTRASQAYIARFSRSCPQCAAQAQKSAGCNHMICARCRAHFCYLCSAPLDPGNPYSHFNNSDTPCYQRLWELEHGDTDPNAGQEERARDTRIREANARARGLRDREEVAEQIAALRARHLSPSISTCTSPPSCLPSSSPSTAITRAHLPARPFAHRLRAADYVPQPAAPRPRWVQRGEWEWDGGRRKRRGYFEFVDFGAEGVRMADGNGNGGEGRVRARWRAGGVMDR